MIPLFRPSVSDAEVTAVTRVLKSGWWAQGPETAAFEREFAQHSTYGTTHAAAVSSGTAALELAARALMPAGGIAIVPALTFVSTALAMQHAGLQVVFADIDERTLCLDWNHVQHLLEKSDRAWNRTLVVPVWYGGYVGTVPPGFPWQVKILEDCAHAAGAARAGTQGIAAAFSFHAVKNLACGDGGMVTSADPEVIQSVRRLRWLGIDKSTYDRDTKRGYSWDYNIAEDGEKAHMNDITAAIGRVQLRRLDDMNYERRKIAVRYDSELQHLSWLRLASPLVDSSNHLFVIRVPREDRDRLIEHMTGRGVSAGVHYKPLYKYGTLFPLTSMPESLPVTEKVWQEVVTLPLFPDMTEAEQDTVINAVRSFSPSRRFF